MKILHLLKTATFSGAENVALTLMDLFKDHETVYASPYGTIADVVKQRGHHYHELKGTSIRELRAVIKEIAPDVIHAHDFTMATNASLAFSGIPVVAHLHNNPPWLRKICPKSIVFACALPFIKQVISVSDSIEKEYVFRGFFKSKNTVVANVVDLDDIKKKAQEFSLPTNYDLIFLGRLTSPKQPIQFCAIVKELQTKFPEIKTVMVGNGPLREDVEDYIDKYRLQNNITLAGFQENPYPYLNAAKIIVMPSQWEGFGLAAIEALCLGKPVICSGAGGLQNIIKESCGAICADMQGYMEKIEQLLSDDGQYKQISEQAQFEALKYGDLKNYKSKILAIYHRV